MKKKPKAPPKASRATSRRLPAPAPERRLILVAEGPIRADWLARLEHVRTEEARWEERLRSFEREGRPAYEKWLQQHFASLRADLVRLAEEVRGFEMVAEEIYAVADRLGISEGRSYAIVKGLIPDPTGFLGRLRTGEFTDEDEEAAGGEDDEDLGEPPPGMKDFVRDMFVEFMRAQGLSRKEAERLWKEQEEPIFTGRAKASPPPGPERAPKPPKVSPAAAAAEGRARELFRQIARRLHPDAGAGAMDERKLGLWHAAQQAWERRDIGGLEAVLWETEPDAAARGQAPVGAIARVVAAVRERIKDLSRQWESIRQTPAGKLVGMDVRQRERFRRQFEAELKRDRLDLTGAKEELLLREADWLRQWNAELAREAKNARRAALTKRQKAALPGVGQFELPF